MRDPYDFTVYQVKIVIPYSDEYDILHRQLDLQDSIKNMGIEASVVGSAGSMVRVIFENQEDLNWFLLSMPDLQQTKYDPSIYEYE